VPKSRVRKRPVYTPPAGAQSKKRAVSPPWLVPAMVASLLLGLIWIALYYITQSNMPGLSSLGGWNLVGGFALIVVGVVLATQWH
jgi:Cell division protein CrgA